MDGKLGSVRISPQVLATIARLTTLSVPGVVRMHRDLSSGVDRLLKGKGGIEGVRVAVEDDAVALELDVIAVPDANLLELGREVQGQVSRAIKDMVGMPVLAVNVHIVDVEDQPAGD